MAYNRFLYRLMKFGQFYGGVNGWFELADKHREKAVQRFSDVIHASEHTFFNTFDRGLPKTKIEYQVEAVFAEPENAAMKELINASSEGDAGIRVNAVFRQLPVGLTFDGKAVLSVGSGAAADLWALSEKKMRLLFMS